MYSITITFYLHIFSCFTIDSKISRLLGEAEARTIDLLANNFNTGKSKGISFRKSKKQKEKKDRKKSRKNRVFKKRYHRRHQDTL